MASVSLSFGGKEIKVYQLDKQAVVVGRDPGVDIVIDNLGVSRSHCQFLQRGDIFVVQDMNSANGTFVNGKKVGEHNLNDNDKIVVGKYALTFKGQSASDAVPAGAPPGAKPAADRIIPDSLNTYMMDGDKIKERLEEMRRQEEAKEAAAAEPPSPAEEAAAKRGSAAPTAAAESAPAAGKSARPERPERHHTRIIMGPKSRGPDARTIKRYLFLSLALNIVLAGVLFLYMLKHLGVMK